MHSHDTIDYEIVLSGKIDIVLQGNQRRTLKAGDILVMGGLPHADLVTHMVMCHFETRLARRQR